MLIWGALLDPGRWAATAGDAVACGLAITARPCHLGAKNSQTPGLQEGN